MKKKSVLFLTFILVQLILPVYALDISLQKSDYQKGETLYAVIEGNIIDSINKENIFFYKGHIKIPLKYDIIKINQTYYIYSVLPYGSGNYSILVQDVYYYDSGQYIKSDLQKNFTINNDTAQFNIFPGFISSTKDFSILLTNNLPTTISIDYTFLNLDNSSTNSVIIGANNFKNINVPLSIFNSTSFSFLQISSSSQSYLVPVYIIKDIKLWNSTLENKTQENNFFTEFSKINVLLKPSESYFDSISLENRGETNIDDIFISISKEIDPYLFIPQNHIVLLKPNEKTEFNFTASFSKAGNYSGFIVISSGNYSEIIDINFMVASNIVSNSSLSSKKNCSEYGGNKCSATQYCSGGSNINSLEGFCCLGECKDFDDESSGSSKNNWYAIILVLLIIGIIGVFLFIKYKKPKFSPEKAIKSKEESFSDRFETKGKLSKI